MAKRFPSENPWADYEPDDEFVVRVEQPALILDSLKKGKGGVIAHNLFEFPVEEIMVELHPETGRFHISVHFNPEYSEEPKINGAKIIQAIQSTYPHRFVGPNQSHIIFRVGSDRGREGTEYIVDPTLFNGFSITTGTIQMSGRLIEKIKPPVIDRKNVTRTLADTAEMIEFVARAAYLATGQRPPYGELVIGPPEEEDEFFEQLRELVESGEERITLDSVGGNKQGKQEMRSLASAIANPDVFKKWGTKPPKGIILYGEPGTGKTLLVRALANEANARFVHVTSDMIGDMWYGNSEKHMKKLFDEARQHNGRTILFFDEMDTMFPHRSGAHEVTNRVMNVFLQNLSGLEENPNVTVIGATNRLEAMDPAVTRSGRFDLKIEIPLPDDAARREIFQIHMDRAEKKARRQLFRRLQWGPIMAATKGWSGADIEAALLVMLNRKASREALTGKQPGLITHKELLAELQLFIPAEEKRSKIGFPGVREGDEERSQRSVRRMRNNR